MFPRVRRTVYAFFAYHDGRFVDIPKLLQGEVEQVPFRQLLALSALTGAEHAVSLADLELLASIPSETWVSPDEAGNPSAEALDELARKGLIVVESNDSLLGELRRRDEALAASQWNVYSALYHSLTKWRDVDYRGVIGGELGEISATAAAIATEHLERYGPPPDAFHAISTPVRTHELPLVQRDEELFEVLRARRTTRVFDRDAPIAESDLATILYYVFGCHGYAPIAAGAVALKRTSPSGGALHPTEAYPLVIRVEGVEPGLYHYRASDHVLDLMLPLDTERAEALAAEFTAGQAYFSSAAALFLLTGRFARSFWKYRKHQRAYAAMLMDAAHLSQTLYLVCTRLGLGAFVTAAINGANVEDALELDGVSEGAIAVCGCGRPAAGASPFEPEFRPYVPRETVL